MRSQFLWDQEFLTCSWKNLSGHRGEYEHGEDLPFLSANKKDSYMTMHLPVFIFLFLITLVSSMYRLVFSMIECIISTHLETTEGSHH